MEKKSFKFQFLEVPEEENVIEGYGSIFGNRDSQGDIVAKGAFTKTLQEDRNRIKFLWQHDIREPIGKPMVLREDNLGLFLKAKISLTDTGRKALILARDGIINEMSIGYDVVKETFDKVKKARVLQEIKLYEISMVTIAANPLAAVTGVKQDYERILHDIEQMKAGRVLSSDNRKIIREVVTALQALLDNSEPEKSTHYAEKPQTIYRINPEVDYQLILEGLKAIDTK